MKNNILGQHIHQLLVTQNLENPILVDAITKWQDNTYINELEVKLADFLQHLGLNLSDNSLIKTPNRVVECLINELFYGLNYANFPDISTFENEFHYTSPLISQGITVNSHCEHHLVAINGKATIAYLPNKKIIGLSKLNQIVDFFAKRPQVQERLTRQITVVLQDILETQDIAIAINAIHNCITLRGIKDTSSEILTIETSGKFTNDTILKANFYQLASTLTVK